MGQKLKLRNQTKTECRSFKFTGWSVSDFQASVGVEDENKETTPILEYQELEISSSEDWDDLGTEWSGTSWVERDVKG